MDRKNPWTTSPPRRDASGNDVPASARRQSRAFHFTRLTQFCPGLFRSMVPKAASPPGAAMLPPRWTTVTVPKASAQVP